MGIPADWPKPGPIDLLVQDLPHRSAAIEWWYVNSHFQIQGNRAFSLFAAFFRMHVGADAGDGLPKYVHALTWALSDYHGRAYFAESRLDPAAPKIALERLRSGKGSQDHRLNRALKETFERGIVPLPDRCFAGEVLVNANHLELDFAGARFEKQIGGSYRLTLNDPLSQMGCQLNFSPTKPPIRHGEDGVIRSTDDADMFYYFIPRCQLSGEILLHGVAQPIINGRGWYDHEFGGDLSGKHHQNSLPLKKDDDPSVRPSETAWNWVSLQLDHGYEVSAYSLCDAATGDRLHQWAVIVDSTGARQAYQDFRLEPMAWWRSVRTFVNYPTKWRLVVPEAQMDLEIDASFPDQEFVTFLSDPAFWEGRCEVTGTHQNKAVAGLGFLERSGFQSVKNLDDFFSAVGTVVRKSVNEILPLAPTLDQAIQLIATPERKYYLDGVDLEQLSKVLIRPIREIVDRGGKSWRSYAALVCCDVVGGDSRQYAQWLAMPELMHVGSLIVDDVQDRSEIRRGGPACHLIYGEALAVNAGTAAYFLGQKLLKADGVSAATQLKMYDLYFEALRAGHAGQALDLDGLSSTMNLAIISNNATVLEQRVLATHRLKTAAPAGALARMGALLGGGTKEQVEAVGRFFEALGLAFQIIDDVLNLRGFAGKLKSPGEDVGNGTITFPVAKAMSRLQQEDRIWLRKTLESKPKGDGALIALVIAKLENCGAIQACVADAEALVENAWQQAQPCLSDSLSKVMLRAFGWYVLDRHY